MSKLPNAAARRRTFKPFEQAPLDGTPFHVPFIFRYNRFAKTYEALMRDQFSGEMVWEPHARLWRASYFCDLLPLSFEPPNSFAVSFIATPARPKTWRQRLTARMFGWLRLPDTATLVQYCWRASAMSAGTAETRSGSGATPRQRGGEARRPNSVAEQAK